MSSKNCFHSAFSVSTAKVARIQGSLPVEFRSVQKDLIVDYFFATNSSRVIES